MEFLPQGLYKIPYCIPDVSDQCVVQSRHDRKELYRAGSSPFPARRLRLPGAATMPAGEVPSLQVRKKTKRTAFVEAWRFSTA
jgi:hypothetical protein